MHVQSDLAMAGTLPYMQNVWLGLETEKSVPGTAKPGRVDS